jgi:hypothetical protein
MLFVRILTIILQRMSRSIQTKEAYPSVITVASLVTSDPNVDSSRLKSKDQKELPTRATSGTLPSTTLQARQHQQQFVPAYQSGKSKKNKSRRYKRQPQKPSSNHGYEGLLSLMLGILRSMATWTWPENHLYRSSKYGSRMMRPFTHWGGVDSTSKGEVSPRLGFWFLNPSACQVCLHCIVFHVICYSCLAFCLRNHLFYPPYFLLLSWETSADIVFGDKS